MNSHKYNDHNKIASLVPFQKSKTAFLIEGLDKSITEDKPYHVEEWDFSTTHTVGIRYDLVVTFSATKSEYVNKIQDALYKFYHYSKANSSSSVSVRMMEISKTSLQHVADCLDGTEWRS